MPSGSITLIASTPPKSSNGPVERGLGIVTLISVPSALIESGSSSVPRKTTCEPVTKPLPVSVSWLPTIAGLGVTADSDGSTLSDAGLLFSPPGISTNTSCHPLGSGGTSACTMVSAMTVVVTTTPPILTNAAAV